MHEGKSLDFYSLGKVIIQQHQRNPAPSSSFCKNLNITLGVTQ